VHADESEAMAKEGIRHTLISAGKYKTEGNPYEPLTAEAKAATQAAIDDVYGLFVADVAKHRGVTPQAVKDGYGQGRALRGKAAIRAGLADRIGTLDSVIQELGATGRRRSATRTAAALRDMPMAALAGTPMHSLSIGIDEGLVAQFLSAKPDEMLTGTRVKADDFESDECETCGAPLTADGECPNGHPQDDDDDINDGAPLDNQAHSQRAADGATARVVSPPTRQAPAPAKEKTVDTPAAPQNGATKTVDFDAMLSLAEAHGKSVPDARAWVAAGLTTEQVKDNILAQMAKPAPVSAAGVRATGMTDRIGDKPFASFGQQLSAIIQVGKRDTDPARRRDLQAQLMGGQFRAGLASGMDETVGAEGGFFIQPELTSQVIDPVYKDDPILSRVTRVPIGSNTNGIRYNVVDETSRATGSRWGGVEMYWSSEAGTLTSSKPKLRLFELNLKKLIGLAYLTEELTLDAPAAESLLTRAFQAELQFTLANAIFRGTGGGQPQGLLNSGALVTVAIEGSQTIANSAQYLSLNITKMLMAIPSSLWGDVIWLYQQEFLPYLMNASLAGSSSGAAVPIFVPMGGFTQRPFDMILGRPAYPSEMCSAVGTPGDILAIAPSQYHLGEKGGVQTAQSIHVRFLNDELTLRWIYRVDGASVWRTAVTPFKGAVARSPWVALGTRS
jgi:HK97 family phage major capsid protein